MDYTRRVHFACFRGQFKKGTYLNSGPLREFSGNGSGFGSKKGVGRGLLGERLRCASGDGSEGTSRRTGGKGHGLRDGRDRRSDSLENVFLQDAANADNAVSSWTTYAAKQKKNDSEMPGKPLKTLASPTYAYFTPGFSEPDFFYT